MSLIKWRGNNGGYSTLPSLSSMVENFFNDEFFSRKFDRDLSIPPVNVMDESDAYNIEVAAPGKSKEDFKLEIDNGVLCISSEKKETKEEKEDKFTRREFSYSSFSRSFWLPENVNTEEIKANYRNGILSITIPKIEAKEAEKAKTIEIA